MIEVEKQTTINSNEEIVNKITINGVENQQQATENFVKSDDKESKVKSKKNKKIIIGSIIFIIVLLLLGLSFYFTQLPIISYNGNQNEVVEYGEQYIDKGIEANTKLKNINDKIIITGDVDTSKLGDYVITYKVPYLNKYKEYTRNVKVIDSKAPEITLMGDKEYSLSYGKEYQEPGYTAVDNYDKEITDKVTVSKVDINDSSYEIHYKVMDSSGNESEIVRKVIVNNAENAGIIYLTFDDGPSSSITPYVLDILKEKGVHATFFILNYSEENESLVKRELEEGHRVGIHGYSHQYSEVYTSIDVCYDNIVKLQQKIYDSTGILVKIVRFPGGSSNTISKNYCEGIMTEISKKILDEGFKYYDWNVDSEDAGGARTKEDVYENVTTSLVQGRRNIVLMHDFGGNNKTLDALSDIIDYGLENGYVFDVITTDTPMITHPINN